MIQTSTAVNNSLAFRDKFSEDLVVVRNLFRLDTEFNPNSLTSNLTPESVTAFVRHLSPVSRQVIQTDEFERLTGVSQMIAKFTSAQAYQTLSRHNHSLHVAAFGKFFAENSVELSAQAEFSSRNLNLNQLSEAVAILHDIAHPPFNHTGEEIIRIAFGKKDFDHDKEAESIILKTPIKDILLKNNLNPEIIANVIGENRVWFEERKLEPIYDVLFSIKELADRISYLASDLACDRHSHGLVYNFGQLKSIISNVSIRSDGLALPDEQASLLSHIRFNHFTNNTFSPYVLLAKEILFREFKILSNERKLTYESFAKSSEEELLGLIDPIKRCELLDGLESHYVPSFSLPKNLLNQSKISTELEQHALRKLLRVAFGEDRNGAIRPGEGSPTKKVCVVIDPSGENTITYHSLDSGKKLDITISGSPDTKNLTVFRKTTDPTLPFTELNDHIERASFINLLGKIRGESPTPVYVLADQARENAAKLRRESLRYL